jgi:NADPH:quinone reductase-like Zn-dependent oxidoreductase
MRLGSLRSSQQVKFFIASFTREDMLVLKELLESGKVKPFVERTYPLANIADAMGHIGAGHARGKIVVTMG